ncbi:MAG: caspase family protein [Deltaproteobacteria bacterium]|nr:caspase family protein [Deltaproteobacteria bacterium]
MKCRALVIAASLSLTFLLPLGAHAQSSEEVRFALVVGNNKGDAPERSLQYAEEEVSRLASVLQAQGGFAHVQLVQGHDRATLEGELRNMRTRIEAARAAGQRTLFMFYYSGHGTKDGLELGDTMLPMRDLRQYLESLQADVRLAFVDACQSGALTGVKGGRRAPAYEIRLADAGAVSGLAIVTSSTANELSQESDELRGSFFSHNIMAGLRGLADSSGDGQISLSELYDYTFKRTLAFTAASLVGSQHPTRDLRLSGAGDVILARIRPGDARLIFPKERSATYAVINNGQVMAEINTSPRDSYYLGVPAGQYRVVRRTLDGVSERTYALAAGSHSAIEPEGMNPVLAQAFQRKKGGDLDVIAGAWLRNEVSAYVSGYSPHVDGTSSVIPSVGVGYAFDLGRLALEARVDLSSFTNTSINTPAAESEHLRAVPMMNALWNLWRARHVALRVGPSVGMSVERQTQDTRASQSFGFIYGGLIDAAIPLAPRFAIAVTGFGGGETYKYQNDTGDADLKTVLRVGVSLGGRLAF